MRYNSIEQNNLIVQLSNLESRTNRLLSMVNGSPINSVRIGSAIITTAKIEDLSITTAKIDTGAITYAKIDSLSADKVTAGIIDADRIGADTITAEKLNVSTLSAISANFGTVNAGSIDGIVITSGDIKTSSGNDRVTMSGTGLRMYSGGNLRVNINGNPKVALFGGAGIGFVETGGSSSTLRGTAGTSSTTGNFIYGSQNTSLLLFQALGTGDVLLRTSNGDMYISCNTFKINGTTKTAIVPTKNGYNALYCVESPEVWFFDIIKNIDSIDPVFLEVTEGEYKTVTNKNGEVLIFRRRKGYKDLRFEHKSKADYDKNNKFWQHQQIKTR